MTAPIARKGKRPARRPKRVDVSFLETVALSYLDRFDASTKRLREVLLRRARAELAGGSPEPPSREQLHEWVEEILARYRGSGLIDDRRFATAAAEHLRERGASQRAIVAKLRAKGIDDQAVTDALESAAKPGEDPELEAARQLVRRRKLGPYRPEGERVERRRKDLAVLARAGFAFDVAARALEAEIEEEF